MNVDDTHDLADAPLAYRTAIRYHLGMGDTTSDQGQADARADIMAHLVASHLTDVIAPVVAQACPASVTDRDTWVRDVITRGVNAVINPD